MPPIMARERKHLAEAGGGAAGGSKAVRAGKTAADQAAEIQRIGGQQMQTPRPACIQTMLRSRWPR